MLKKLSLIILVLFLSSCAHLRNHEQTSSHYKGASSYRVKGKTYHVLKSSKNYRENGIATWYGKRFHHRKTNSGERYNMYHLTAAHKTLPLQTKVLVTNLRNGKQVTVRINDRGPFRGNRLIDLSYAAAKKIGLVNRGMVMVSVKALS
jgi:rare lipoprotein A